MKFIKEMGRILFNDGGSLIIPGEVGHVDFPAQIIYDQHKYRPGVIIELEHTHPTGMFSLSQRDSDSKRQTFWNSHHNNTHCNNHVIY